MYKAVTESIKTVNSYLKVGGPGVAYYSMIFSVKKYREDFIEYCKNNSVPLDFYSFHLYDVKNPFGIKAYGDTIRNILDLNGFANTEIVITEINPGLGDPIYENTIRGAVWNVSALITCNKSNVDNLFWYRGTLLSPLVGTDIGNNLNLTWNGLGYKAYKLFYQSVDSLVQSDGDEIVAGAFGEDTTSFLTLAGISSNEDTLCILLSNLKSSINSITLNLSSIPWNGNTRIEEYSIRSSNNRLSLISKDTTISGGILNYVISSINYPSAFVLKIYKHTQVSVEEITNRAIPNESFLHQNYPNPFNPSTVIRYQIPVSGNVTLKVYDILGKEIATLVGEVKEAGSYNVTFNASQLASGVYFYNLLAGNYREVKKMILLK